MNKQLPKLLDRVAIGIKRKGFSILIGILAVWAVLWTLLEPILGLAVPADTFLTPGLRIFLFATIAIGVGIFRNSPPSSMMYYLGGNKRSVEIIFDDLFTYSGILAIPASRFLLETEVIANSLQGIVISRAINKYESAKGLEVYLESLRMSLSGTKFEDVSRMGSDLPEKRYSLGTTANINLDGKEYSLFAVTETEMKGQISSENCTASRLLQALTEFWRYSSIHARSEDINMPLVGAGVAGVRLTPMQILCLHLAAITDTVNSHGNITNGAIRIIIHPSYYNLIDLKSITSIS